MFDRVHIIWYLWKWKGIGIFFFRTPYPYSYLIRIPWLMEVKIVRRHG
jgi:hypothetical protein|tara:strand:+ start:371 stop:514 length:144 start_codon:yes stop_codon:yes gene_type:complete